MLKEKNWREGVIASCPECEAPLERNVWFCPECGAKIKPAAHCTEGSAELKKGAKFCADRGTKVVRQGSDKKHDLSHIGESQN